MRFSRFLSAPKLLGLATLSALALLGSCESSTSSSSGTPTGPQSITYKAELAELPGTWALPDSIRWSVDGNAQVAKLQVDDLEVIVTAELSSPPTDTVDIALFRTGLRYATWHFRYRGSGDLAAVGGKVDSLALELLRRAGDDATPESIRVVLAKALVEVDSFLIRHPYPKNMPVGIDSAAVLREYAIRVAASGRSFAQVANSATLPVDTVILRKLIRSLAIWGDIKDTTSIFPPPAKPRDTTIVPRDTTKPRDTTIVPRDTTKPIAKDTVAPVVERLSFPLRVPYDSAKVTVGWFASDNRGLKMVSINHDTLVSDQKVFKFSMLLLVGDNRIVFAAIDSAGNVARDSVVVTRASGDTTKPSLRRLSPTMDTLLGGDSLSTVVSWLVTDNGRIDSVRIDKSVVTLRGDTASARIVLRYGPNRIAISARDVNGNIARDSILVVLRDNVAPRLKRVGPMLDTTVPYKVESCTVAWSVTDNARLKVVTINGVLVAGVDGMYSRTVPLLVGTNRVAAIATDSVGNVSMDTIVVMRKPDTIPPVLTRVMVHSGDSLVSPGVAAIQMSWGATDNDSVAMVTINGSPATRYKQTSQYYSNNILAYGRNSIIVAATDISGNVSRDTVVVTRIKDTLPPVLKRDPGTTDTTVAFSIISLYVAWRVSDQYSGVIVSVNDSVIKGASSVYARTISLAVGENRIVIKAKDDVGNVASDTILVVRKPDTVPPQIVRMAGTADRTIPAAATMRLSWKVSDNAGIGIKSVTLKESIQDREDATYELTEVDGVYSRLITSHLGINTFIIIATDSSGNISRDTIIITGINPSEAGILRDAKPGATNGALLTALRTPVLRSSQRLMAAAIPAPSAPVPGKES